MKYRVISYGDRVHVVYNGTFDDAPKQLDMNANSHKYEAIFVSRSDDKAHAAEQDALAQKLCDYLNHREEMREAAEAALTVAAVLSK